MTKISIGTYYWTDSVFVKHITKHKRFVTDEIAISPLLGGFWCYSGSFIVVVVKQIQPTLTSHAHLHHTCTHASHI